MTNPLDAFEDGILNEKDIGTIFKAQDHTDDVIAKIKNGLTRGLVAVGMQAESDCAKQTPVDTGRLRNSITSTLSGDGKSVYVGTNVEYAKYVHNRVPYLTKPAQENKSKYAKIIKASIKE